MCVYGVRMYVIVCMSVTLYGVYLNEIIEKMQITSIDKRTIVYFML